jgi:uncharacterized SAM-binding protein YcdF (DUF218 family)
MDYLKIMLPGSLLFFVLILIIACLLFFSKKFKRTAAFLFLINSFFYLILSIPICSEFIARPLLLSGDAFSSSHPNNKIQAIVLLDAGTERYSIGQNIFYERPNKTALLRALEVIRVYHDLGTHPLIIISGGDNNDIPPEFGPDASVLRSLLIQNGITPGNIILDSMSPNTREHALTMIRLLEEHRIKHFVLVTSPTHLRRATRAFNRAGLYPIPNSSQNFIDEFKGWKRYLPTYKSLVYVEEVMHDYLGLIYYYMRDWI